jgi:hypothetical protein
MYAVKYKENIVIGIIPWNNSYIMKSLLIRFGQSIELPKIEPSIDKFPYVVNEDCIIYRAEEDRPDISNTIIEYYEGPKWVFKNNKVIAKYEVKKLSLEAARSKYKQIAAEIRYAKETSSINVTINGLTHKINTDRFSRSKYMEKIASSNSMPIVWKFDEAWQSITKEDLQHIIDSIDYNIQKAFNEEYDLNNLIDHAKDINELLSIEELNKGIGSSNAV